MKYAILMPHGVDLRRCLERVRSAQNTEESTSCTLSIKIEPDGRGFKRGIRYAAALGSSTLSPEYWVARSSRATTSEENNARENARAGASFPTAARLVSPDCRNAL